MYYIERNRINDHNVYKMTIDEVTIEKIEYATKSFFNWVQNNKEERNNCQFIPWVVSTNITF
jgi:hypothetical protein